jgi:hypothetical protein
MVQKEQPIKKGDKATPIQGPVLRPSGYRMLTQAQLDITPYGRTRA